MGDAERQRADELDALRRRCQALEDEARVVRAESVATAKHLLAVIDEQRTLYDQALSMTLARHASVSLRSSRALASVANVRRWLRDLPVRSLARQTRRRHARAATAVAPAVARLPLGVNVAGYISAESGMGEATRCSLRALQHAGIPFALNNVPGPQRTADPAFTDFTDDHPHPFNLVHLNADNMAAFARTRGARYFRDRYTIGYWFWELEEFRPDFAAGFDYVDEVWVASAFSQRSIGRGAPVPVVHVPLGLPEPQVGRFGREHFGLPRGPFIFLYTFDVSSQVERKNPLGAIQAFRRAAFAPGEALLLLKFTNGHFDRAAVRRLADAASGLDVVMLEVALHRHEVGALMNVTDACLSLHRAEGFGMTIAEQMMLGKPAIATAYSGNLDFMTPDVSHLVSYATVPITRNHGPYLPGYRWAEPDIEDAARCMRDVVASPERARDLGARGAAHVRRVLAPARMSALVSQRLRAIQAGTAVVDATVASTAAELEAQ